MSNAKDATAGFRAELEALVHIPLAGMQAERDHAQAALAKLIATARLVHPPHYKEICGGCGWRDCECSCRAGIVQRCSPKCPACAFEKVLADLGAQPCKHLYPNYECQPPDAPGKDN